MADNSQESQGTVVGQQPDATTREGDRQSMLLKLAERTVLQAEALAQEITDHARQESEAEGARILAQHTEQAQAEAQVTMESAQRQSETIIDNASAEALAESEKTLSEAQSESAKIFAKAQSESDAMFSKARSESEEGLAKAQAEGREMLDKARQEALAIVNASQTRADSTASNAKLKAEFVIRQTTQNVAEGIRSAVLEICDNLLPTVEEITKELPEAPVAEPVGHTAAVETAMLENGASHTAGENSEPAQDDPDTQPSDKPTARKSKSSAKTQ